MLMNKKLLELQNVKEQKPKKLIQPLTMAGCTEKTAEI